MADINFQPGSDTVTIPAWLFERMARAYYAPTQPDSPPPPPGSPGNVGGIKPDAPTEQKIREAISTASRPVPSDWEPRGVAIRKVPKDPPVGWERERKEEPSNAD